MFQEWKDVDEEQVLFVLKEIHTLFSNPNNWIEWPLAINEKGIEVLPSSADAKKWSLMGASIKYASSNYPSPLSDYIDCALRDFLNEISDDARLKSFLSYDDEFAIISLGLEKLNGL